MTVAATLLLLLLPVQAGEDPLEKAWPTLIETWKAVEAHKKSDKDPMSDDYIRLMGKLHDAFEAAGFLEKSLDFQSAALKRLFKNRAAGLLQTPRTMANTFVWVGGGGRGGQHLYQTPSTSTGLQSLITAAKRLQELRRKGFDDEDNVADEMTIIRKSLKDMGLTADDTPLWLRRRLVRLTTALVLEEAYPGTRQATEEQAKAFRTWIENLGSQDIEIREQASRDLMREGEAALPLLREALRSEDPEVVQRVKRILGVDHAPWKTSMGPGLPGNLPVWNAESNVVQLVEGILEFEPVEKKEEEKEKDEEDK